jgi:hypothetical protein
MTTPRTVELLTLADRGFELPLAVLGRSALDHLAPDVSLNLTVIDGGLGTATRDALEASWDDSRLRARWVAPDYGAGKAPRGRGRIPALTFARLSIAEFVPDECERAVVLDADSLVLEDLGRLLEVPMQGQHVAAPRDPFIATLGSPDGIRDSLRLGLRVDAPYFTGAAMVIDMRRWREDDIGSRALRFVREHADSLRAHDQDALNAVLCGRWHELDARWQVQPRLLGLAGSALPHLSDEVRQRAAQHAAVVHFSGRLKPWLYRGATRFDALFFETLDRTHCRGTRPARDVRSLAYGAYDRWLRRRLYPLEARVLRALSRSSVRP